MTDFLLEMGRSPSARSLFKTLGLPLPLPEHLRRDRSPVSPLPLKDKLIAFAAAQPSPLLDAAAWGLLQAGASPVLLSDILAPQLSGPSEAYGRPARLLATLPERQRLDGLCVDASSLASVASLRFLHETIAPLLARLAKSGRVILLARPLDETASPEDAATQAALDGFLRSLAKEIGRSGATASLLRVSSSAYERLAGGLGFFFSARSAFVTGQTLPFDAQAKALKTPFLPRSRPLDQKIALVTGAARGIGEATAKALAREGALVLCLDRPAEDGPTSRLARSIQGRPLLVDLADPTAPSVIAAEVQSLGGVDIVVHNAGITRDKTLARMKAADWDLVLDINLAAVVRLHQALLPHLRDEGRILVLSSIAGIAGNVGQTAYAASKAGIAAFAHRIAAELAPRGITANALAPGFIETQMTQAVPLAIREVARRLSSLNQGGLPDDIAEAIVFFASPASQGITGRTLRICGGAFLGA